MTDSKFSIEDLEKMTLKEIKEKTDSIFLVIDKDGKAETFMHGPSRYLLSNLMCVLFDVLYENKVKTKKVDFIDLLTDRLRDLDDEPEPIKEEKKSEDMQ